MSGLDDVLITDELARRPSRPPEHEAENRALRLLAEALSADPRDVLQKVAGAARDLCRADSAAVGILEPGGEHGVFRWHAVASAFAGNAMGAIPREETPCGEAITRDEVLLFCGAERHFPALRGTGPRICENLIAPWSAGGRPIGTLSLLAHTPERRFDAEDARLLRSLAHFASAAWQTSLALEGAERTAALSVSEERLTVDLAGMRRLYDLHTRIATETDLQTALDEILAAACEITATDRGCIQLVSNDGERLEMSARRGYAEDSPFIELFRPEGLGEGRDARLEQRPFIVEDRAAFPAVRPGIDAALHSEGIVAWQSVPMVSRKGETLGVLSTQFSRRHRPGEDELRLIGLLAWTAADFVERHRAEAALRETGERFRIIVESARDYAIFTMDPERRIVSWPPGAEAVFGWRAEEIAGRSADILFVTEDRKADQPEWEITTARDTGVAPNVRWHLRKDGVRVFIEGSVRALRGPGGELQGFLKIGQDVTERRRTEAALHQTQERLRSLIEGIPQLVWRAVDGGEWTWASPQWTTYTGHSDAASRGHGWLQAVHPDDRERTIAVWNEAEAKESLDLEYRIHRAGEDRYRWFQTRATPVRGDDGSVVEWFGTSTDIDDLRRLQDEQKVILAELQHRSRNLLAVVRSTAGRTLPPGEAVDEFAGRLAALSRVQGFLSRSDNFAVGIGDIVHAEIEAHGDGENVRIEGPNIDLPGETAQPIALAVHELATNSVKYGALTAASGHLDVVWRIEATGGGGRQLVLDWTETGVTMPPRAAETSGPLGRKGYGRELIERALPYQLGAETHLVFAEDGVRCSIRVPLPALSGRKG